MLKTAAAVTRFYNSSGTQASRNEFTQYELRLVTLEKKYEAKNGLNPLTLVADDLEQAWGSPAVKQVVFPIFLKAGKK